MVSFKRPYFSVVIPIYNVEKYILECLKSVENQSFSDYEVLMIDDGSQDNSDEICQQYVHHDDRFKLIYQVNRGLSGARNTGIRHAKGTYIALLDADDRWHQDKLKAHYYLHQLNPDIEMSYSQSALIDLDGYPLHLKQTPKIRDISIYDIFCRNPIGNGSAAVFHIKTIKKIGFYQNQFHDELQFFDETLKQSEDIECWIRLYTKTKLKLMGIEYPLTEYRINIEGLSANYRMQLKNWHHMVKKVERYNPELLKTHQCKALSYQLRYISRWAIIQGQKKESLSYIYQSIRQYPKILLEEPIRTLVTVISASLLFILPRQIFTTLFKFVQQKFGHVLQQQSHSSL